jgi:tetratricopeptide (TPR) repeat protein
MSEKISMTKTDGMANSLDFSDEVFAEAKDAFIKGQYQVTEPFLQQLVLRGTRNVEVFQMLATIAYDRGQFNKAIKTFKRALEIDPTYTDASVGLSIILNDLGRYDEGQKVFQDAQIVLKNKKTSSEPWLDEKIARKHEELADLYNQANRFNDSLDQLLKAHKLTTRKSELTLRVAEAYVKTGDLSRATKELKNLIREYPQLNIARIRLGQIYYNQNLIAEATEQWENVLHRDPVNAEAKRLIKMAEAAGLTSVHNPLEL